jgi:hypothetical protein
MSLPRINLDCEFPSGEACKAIGQWGACRLKDIAVLAAAQIGMPNSTPGTQ